MPGETPRPRDLQVIIDGEPYALAPEDKAKEAGGRAWQVEVIASQEADGKHAAAVRMPSFHNGGGFSFQGLPFSYEYARGGWDASQPGRFGSWPELVRTVDQSSADYRGWQVELNGYLYVCRGRYVRKFAIDAAVGADAWPIVETHDLGDDILVGGRPVRWRGKLYVPRVSSIDFDEDLFHQLTTVATNVTEVQTLTITGTPGSGDFTVTFDGKDSAAIDFDATASEIQAALRAIPGLEQVTVAQTAGSAPNFTYTVTMTGAPAALGASSPPEMTVVDTFDTGGVTPATTTPGTSDRWDAGPATREARCFRVWRGLLCLAQDNQVRSCAGDPLQANDWAPDTTDGYLFGDSGYVITDLGVRQVELVAQKEEGPFTMNPDLESELEIPDLEDIVDGQNGIGMAYAQGMVLNPHRAGLLRWDDESYAFVGPNQEGQLEGDLTPGWGNVASVVTYGKYAFVAANDSLRGQGALWSMQPGTQEREPVWQSHDLVEGLIEDVALISITEADPVPAQYPESWSTTDAGNGGTIDWSDVDNAGADDGAAATALAGTSKRLQGVHAMGVPDSATITGITVEVRRKVGTP